MFIRRSTLVILLHLVAGVSALISQESIFDIFIDGALHDQSFGFEKDEHLLQNILLGKYSAIDQIKVDSHSVLDLLAKAIQYSRQGQFSESDFFWEQINGDSSIFNPQNQLYVHIEYAAHLVRKDNLHQADSLYNLLVASPNRLETYSAFLNAYLYEQIGLHKYLVHEYDESQFYMHKADSIWKKSDQEFHPWLINYWNHYALLLTDLGDYEQAENGFNKALTISAIQPDQTKLFVADITSNLGYLYQQLGDYHQALDYYKQAKAIYNDHNLYLEKATLDNNLALLYDEADSLELAKTYYKEALLVYENHLGKDNLPYALILSNLGGLLDYEESYPAAEDIYLQSLAVIQRLQGKENTYYTTLQNNLALVYENMEKPDEAIALYLEAMNINSRVLGTRHPKYVELLYNLAGLYSYTNPEKSLEVYDEANNKQLDLLKYYYAGFDEETRINYLEEINIEFEKYYATAVQNLNPQVARAIFEFSLKTNGLAAEYSRDLKGRIKNESAETKALFNNWQKLRDSIAIAMVLSEEERVTNNIDLVGLMRSVDQSESKWIRSLGDKINQDNTFNEIKDKLKKPEAAISFIRFEDYVDGFWQDTVWYYALITDPELNFPKVLRVTSEQQLKTELNKGSFPLQYKEQKSNLSSFILDPIYTSLVDKQKIYISPVGLIHRVPFNALATGDKYFIEEFEIQILTNLKDLTRPISARTDQNALFVGGLDYNGSVNEPKNIIPSFQKINGTDREVKSSQAILNKKGWNTQLIQNHAATKAEILTRIESNNIQICHFATHGYAFEYIPNVEFADLSVRNRIITSRNPLLRSGLILSGANLYWNHNPKDKESGILSAYDIANLRLNKTALVILSSCESGIGDIQNEEGVFGLPRAFKIAGAQKIIYTLWQIDDQKSNQFINYFYKYFSRFNDINQAFRKAQIKMSKKYDPFYWAGFVLVN